MENLVLPVIEMFSSLQGEGKYTGVPSFFIRTSGCNLRCAFKGSICDTPYSSYNPEKPLYNTMDELVWAFEKMAKKYPNTKHIVITGGEPLLHRKALSKFLSKIDWFNYTITVETNGTQLPVTIPMDEDDDIDKFDGGYIDLYSISPKLSTSVGTPNERLTQAMIDRHNKLRLNPEALANLFIYSNNIQLKFVYSGPEVEQEIDELIKSMADCLKKKGYDECNEKFLNRYIMLMPEGITNEQLSQTRKEAAEVCIRRGWNYTDRTHIVIWGDKRGV